MGTITISKPNQPDEIAAEEARKTAEENYKATKASAKAKLIAGEPLTDEEADTIVL